MIEKVLVLSTGHAPSPDPNFGDVRFINHDYGWIVFVCQDTKVFDWFKPILDRALAENCSIILFDRDVETVEDFKVYNW